MTRVAMVVVLVAVLLLAPMGRRPAAAAASACIFTTITWGAGNTLQVSSVGSIIRQYSVPSNPTSYIWVCGLPSYNYYSLRVVPGWLFSSCKSWHSVYLGAFTASMTLHC